MFYPFFKFFFYQPSLGYEQFDTAISTVTPDFQTVILVKIVFFKERRKD